MKTKLLYLYDSYTREMDAIVLDVDSPSPGLYRLVLDQTVFYPIGGGQACDQGKLTSDNWNGNVQEVVLKDGEVRHFIQLEHAPKPGDRVHGTIDWDRRYKLMKIHSAGHVIDFAMHILGFSPEPLLPVKGDHGKKAFILYQGSVGKDIKQELEYKANEIIAKNLSISWEFVSYDELKKDAIYLQPGLPTNKPLRKITLEGVGSVADGGTQIRKTGEIGKITVLSVEADGNSTTIRYQISQ